MNKSFIFRLQIAQSQDSKRYSRVSTLLKAFTREHRQLVSFLFPEVFLNLFLSSDMIYTN